MPLTESGSTESPKKRKITALSSSDATAQDEQPKKISGYQLLKQRAERVGYIAEQKDIEIKKLTQQLADEKASIAAATLSVQNARRISIKTLKRQLLGEKATNQSLTKRNTELSAQMALQSTDLAEKTKALKKAKDTLQKHETTITQQKQIIVDNLETITHYKNVSWGSVMGATHVITEQRDDHLRDQQTISRLEQESTQQHAEIVKLRSMLELKAEALEHSQDSKSLLRSPIAANPFPFWSSLPQNTDAISSTSTASSMPYLDLTEEDIMTSFKL